MGNNLGWMWSVALLGVASLAHAQPVLPPTAAVSGHTCPQGAAEIEGDGVSAPADLVATAEAAAGVSSAADEDFVYLQLHLATDPRVGGGSCADDGFFGAGTYAALLDFDGSPDGYEVAVVLDAAGADRGLKLHTNTSVSLAGSVLDPFDEAPAQSYSPCTHVGVEAEADGSYTLTLAVPRDDLLDAANAVLSPDLATLGGSFAVAAATSDDGGGLDADQSCIGGEATCGSATCPSLEASLSYPLIIDTFVDLHLEPGTTLSEGTPTLTGVTEPGATVEVSDGTSSAFATVQEDGRFSFDLPGAWGVDSGDTLTLEVTAADLDGNEATVDVDVSIGGFDVELVSTGLAGGLLDTLLGAVTVDTDAPLGSVISVQAVLDDGRVVHVCASVVLVLGLNLCTPNEEALFDGASGTLRATVDPLLGGPVTDLATFAIELLGGELDSPVLTTEVRPTFSGSTNAPDGSDVEVRVDGELVCVAVTTGGDFSCTPSEDALDGEGEHLVEVTVESSATGTTTTFEAVVDLDTVDPVLNVLGPLDGTVSGSGEIEISGSVSDLNLTGNVDITVTDDNEGVVFDGEVDVVGGLFSLPLTGLADDTYTVVTVATDLLGNEVEVEIVIVIDSSALKVTITSPTGGSVLDTATPTFNGTTDGAGGSDVEVRSDADVVLCTTAVQPDQSWSCTSSLSLTEGAHSTTVTVDDGVTTPGSASVAFVTDTEAPVLGVEDPSPAGCTLGSTVRVTGTVTDTTTTTVEVSLLDATNAVAAGPVPADVSAGTFTAVLTGVTPGSYTVSVEAEDAAGHSSTDASHPVVVSDGAGALDVTAPGGWADGPDFTVAGTTSACPGSDLRVTVELGGVDVPLCSTTVAGDGSFGCQVDDAVLSSGNDYDLTASLDDGVHPSVEVDFEVTVDTEAPTVSISSPSAGAVLAESGTTLEGAVSDDLGTPTVRVSVWREDDSTLLVDGVLASVSGGGWSLAASGFEAGVRYLVEVTAEDEAGNAASAGPVSFDGPAEAGGNTGGTNGGGTGDTGNSGGSSGSGGTTSGAGGNTGTSGGSMATTADSGSTGGGKSDDGTDTNGDDVPDYQAPDSPEVRAGSSIFGCAAGGAGSPSAWLGVLLVLLLRRRHIARG